MWTEVLPIELHSIITFLVALIVVVNGCIVDESFATVVESRELIIGTEIDPDGVVILLEEELSGLLVVSITVSKDVISLRESNLAVELSSDITVDANGDNTADDDSTWDDKAFVDGIANDVTADVISDVDSIVTDNVDDVTFIVKGSIVIDVVDVSDDSESVVDLIWNVSAMPDVSEASISAVDSTGKIFVVVDITGDKIAAVDSFFDVTDGLDDVIGVVDISSNDAEVNANVENGNVVGNSDVVESVDDIVFSVVGISTSLVEVTWYVSCWALGTDTLVGSLESNGTEVKPDSSEDCDTVWKDIGVVASI